MDITMTVEDIIRQEREINKLREKLRKAEARATQAENKAERIDGYYAGVWWVVTRVLVQNGESRAIPLIKHLWSCNKADMNMNTRLLREKAAWMKEREELLEQIEQLKTEVKTIAEGVAIGREDTE